MLASGASFRSCLTMSLRRASTEGSGAGRLICDIKGAPSVSGGFALVFRTCADDGQYAPPLTDTADESPQPIRPPTSYHVVQERFCGQIGPMVQSSETDRALNAGQ